MAARVMIAPRVKVVLYRYMGFFYKTTRNGWRRFGQVGNYEVSMHFAQMLGSIGIKVLIEDLSEENSKWNEV